MAAGTKRSAAPKRAFFDLKRYLLAKNREVNVALDRFLPRASVKPGTIHQAMRYSLFAGGKRLRPILCLAAAEACIVSGALSYEYWGSQLGSDGRFREGEMEERVGHFPNAEHHWFDHSGHMVHYDEPDRLANTLRTFLEKHYV